jgi:hypothetical protein
LTRPALDWTAIDASLANPADIRYRQTGRYDDAHVFAYYHHMLSAAAHVRDYYCQPLVARRTIEAIVNRYLWMTERTDPRSPEVAAALATWARIAEHALALDAALADLEDLETGPVRSLKYAIATNPLTPDADYLALKQQLATAARWAAIAARGWPKSVRWEKDVRGQPISTKAGHNRSRGDDVDRLIGDLLAFWVRRGGYVGKGIDSPSTRFVVATVDRILLDVRLPRAITDFVRDRGCI